MNTINLFFKTYFSHLTGTRLKVITFITALVFLLLVFKASILVIFHARFMFNASVYSLIFLNFCLLFCKKKGWTIFVSILFLLTLFVNVFDTFVLSKQLLSISKYESNYKLDSRELGHDGYRYIIKENDETYVGYTVNRKGVTKKEISKDGKLWTSIELSTND